MKTIYNLFFCGRGQTPASNGPDRLPVLFYGVTPYHVVASRAVVNMVRIFAMMLIAEEELRRYLAEVRQNITQPAPPRSGLLRYDQRQRRNLFP